MMEEITAIIYAEGKRFSATAASYDALLDGGQNITCILQAESDEVTLGQSYTLCGQWKRNPRFGQQFHAQSFLESAPISRRAVIYYLTRLPGIGVKTAEKIADHYGEKTLEGILANPDFIACLPRFNRTKAEGLAEIIRGDLELITTKIEVQSYLLGSGFPHNLTEKLYRRFGVKTLELLHRNPYLLLAYDGCGFQRVDAFALKNGFNPLRLKRQAYFLLYAMAEAQDVWFSLPEVHQMLVKQFGANAQVEWTLKLLKRARRIVATKVTPDGKPLSEWQLALATDHDTEATIAASVRRRVKTQNYTVKVDTSCLTETQAEALKTATSCRIGCFTGGPGTGKTYSVARYIKGIVDGYGTDAILVVAPTGKAVVRSREMLASIGVDCAASTIHSYLATGASYYKFIVCDEASMIDAGLMSMFLTETEDSSILFVGDDGQLLPVGKGRPFADFLASGTVPTGKLTQTMRNSGRIVKVCHKIRQNTPWQASEKLDLDAGENLQLVASSDFLSTTKDIIQQWRGKLDPIRDVQVIVGINRGETGRITMNTELQKFMNPSASIGKYRVGDPVICLKNDTYRDPDGAERIRLSNGEIGYCTEVTPNILVDFGGEKQVRISEKQVTFDLAYAVTCHKMQGSETPLAIVFLDPSYQAKMVCTREWLYTAISRAKRVCYLIGDQRTAEDYCRKLGNVRKTFLAEELRSANHDENTTSANLRS